MKTISLLVFFLISSSAFAKKVCQYRFTEGMGLTVSVNDVASGDLNGTISWDDANTCVRSGDDYLCTEIYPGTYNVKFADITPETTQDITVLKIESVADQDDLGNRSSDNEDMNTFIQTATFTSGFLAEPNLAVNLGGINFPMKCSEQ